MKKLMVILFENVFEYNKCANAICDKFSWLPEKSEFLGTWWIEFNQEEVYSAISCAVNHFIDNTDKTEIIFVINILLFVSFEILLFMPKIPCIPVPYVFSVGVPMRRHHFKQLYFELDSFNEIIPGEMSRAK